MHGADESQAVAPCAAAKTGRVSGDDDRISRIRERAYHLWERDRHGHDVEHWLRAEREIDAESATKKTPARATAERSPSAKPLAKKPSAKKKRKPLE